MKKILIFDDRPQIRDFLRSSLESETTKVLIYSRVYDVNEYFENNGINIDGIIVDMMMPTNGLTDNEKTLAGGGLLTGWIWLWKHCNPSGKSNHPLKDIPIIIYSDYSDCQFYLDSLDPNSPEWKFANSGKIKFISKRNADEYIIRTARDHFGLC